MNASRVANELLATVVQNGATRQVVAATVSALFRLLLNIDGDLEDEVRDRMAAWVSGYIISGSAEQPSHQISTADAKHLQETWRTKTGDWHGYANIHPLNSFRLGVHLVQAPMYIARRMSVSLALGPECGNLCRIVRSCTCLCTIHGRNLILGVARFMRGLIRSLIHLVLMRGLTTLVALMVMQTGAHCRLKHGHVCTHGLCKAELWKLEKMRWQQHNHLQKRMLWTLLRKQ